MQADRRWMSNHLCGNCLRLQPAWCQVSPPPPPPPEQESSVEIEEVVDEHEWEDAAAAVQEPDLQDDVGHEEEKKAVQEEETAEAVLEEEQASQAFICAICLADIAADEWKEWLQCTHCFHFQCLEAYRQAKHCALAELPCPVCKFSSARSIEDTIGDLTDALAIGQNAMAQEQVDAPAAEEEQVEQARDPESFFIGDSTRSTESSDKSWNNIANNDGDSVGPFQ